MSAGSMLLAASMPALSAYTESYGASCSGLSDSPMAFFMPSLSSRAAWR